MDVGARQPPQRRTGQRAQALERARDDLDLGPLGQPNAVPVGQHQLDGHAAACHSGVRSASRARWPHGRDGRTLKWAGPGSVASAAVRLHPPFPPPRNQPGPYGNHRCPSDPLACDTRRGLLASPLRRRCSCRGARSAGWSRRSRQPITTGAPTASPTASGERQRLDLYVPNEIAARGEGAHAPVVVFLYGGSWQRGTAGELRVRRRSARVTRVRRRDRRLSRLSRTSSFPRSSRTPRRPSPGCGATRDGTAATRRGSLSPAIPPVLTSRCWSRSIAITSPRPGNRTPSPARSGWRGRTISCR